MSHSRTDAGRAHAARLLLSRQPDGRQADGRQPDGRQAPIGYSLNCLYLTIFVPKFSTINISFNLYIVLNSYKSYIVVSLSVRSTAVPAAI